MNQIYVLRNNREAGPFTQAELKKYGLLSTDLIWIDGESQAWRAPSEIEGLTAIAVEEKKVDLKPAKQEPVAAQSRPQQAIGNAEFYTEAAHQEHLYGPQNKTVFYRPEKRRVAPPYTIGARLFGAVVLLFALFLCGFVVVNMLKQAAEKPAASSQALELKAETLPASNASHTAEAPPVAPVSPPPTETKDTITTLATATQKPDKLPEAKAAKTKTPKKTAAPPIQPLPVPVMTEPVDEKPEPPKPKEKPALQLAANDYKTGLFGGVSDLQITVSNPADESVAKAVVEIDFLKPNGSVVKTQTVTAENIAAGGAKTISVPSSSRGVKVRYRVVSVE